jgi:NitT/TauT family transport system permease protein
MRHERLTIVVLQVSVLVLFLLLWEWAARTRFIDPLFIGQPTRIFTYLFHALFVDYRLWIESGWTLLSTLTAFILASMAGVACGLLFALNPAAEKFLDPLFTALNAMPRIALAPLFLLWFGLGAPSKLHSAFR